VDPYKATRALARCLPADHVRREVRLAACGWFQPSLVFYSRREVVRVQHPVQALEFLNQPLPVYLFVPEQTWADLCRLLPMQAGIVGRRRDLYTGQVILMVTNQPADERHRVVSSE
jgi:hypothetical protein